MTTFRYKEHQSLLSHRQICCAEPLLYGFKRSSDFEVDAVAGQSGRNEGTEPADVPVLTQELTDVGKHSETVRPPG